MNVQRKVYLNTLGFIAVVAVVNAAIKMELARRDNITRSRALTVTMCDMMEALTL